MFSESKVSQKDHKTTNTSNGHKKETPTNVNIRCNAVATICLVRSIGINHKEFFRKSGISEKSAGQTINEEDDPFKDITADLEETITELRERLPEEALEELNATDLLDVDAELSTNGEKPSDAEIIAEIRSEVPDDKDQTDIDFVIDDPKVPPTEIEIEKATEALEELSMFCEDGEILRTAVSNVNRLSQIAMLKCKKQKTIKDYFRN